MKEIDGVKVFEDSDTFKEVKARDKHKCNLCEGIIEKGEKYCRYIEKETGWEQKACARHIDTKVVSQFNNRRREFEEKRERGKEIVLETDASGPEGERWAFIVYVNGQEVHREHGYTPNQINDITPAEGYAVIMAVKWLCEAERKGKIEMGLPVIVGSDNYPVHAKLRTQSERGKYDHLWRELNQVLLTYRKEGRLFIEFGNCSAADDYASKNAFESE